MKYLLVYNYQIIGMYDYLSELNIELKYLELNQPEYWYTRKIYVCKEQNNENNK